MLRPDKHLWRGATNLRWQNKRRGGGQRQSKYVHDSCSLPLEFGQHRRTFERWAVAIAYQLGLMLGSGAFLRCGTESRLTFYDLSNSVVYLSAKSGKQMLMTEQFVRYIAHPANTMTARRPSASPAAYLVPAAQAPPPASPAPVGMC